MTYISIPVALATRKEVAQVSNEARFHGTMRESVDFDLEAMFVMRSTLMPASSQDPDVATMFLNESARGEYHSYTISVTTWDR